MVFDDADLQTAVETAMVAKFRNSGQSCIAANRIYAQKGIHDAFVSAFAERVRALKLGDGFDPQVDIGPLIDKAAVAKVDEHFHDARTGAELLAGGSSQDTRLSPPTLLAGVRRDALLSREETFGPPGGGDPLRRYRRRPGHGQRHAFRPGRLTSAPRTQPPSRGPAGGLRAGWSGSTPA